MFEVNVFKKNICVFALLLINFLFAYKYLYRVTNWAIPIAIVLTSISFLFLYKKRYSFPKYKYLEIGLLSSFFIVSFIVWYNLPVEKLNVDRWSVITSFWDAHFANIYPYFAKSNVGNPPGPMPFYFLLALPFYSIGELGFLSLIGVLLFFFLLKYFKIEFQRRILILLFLLTAIFNLWEVTVRSNIFFNATLVLGSLIYMIQLKKINMKSIIISSLLIGLLLSTRNVFAIPYIICVLYLLKNNLLNFKQLIYLGVFSFLFFCLTFLPFVYKYWDEFLEINPFIVQSTFLIPFEYTLFFIFLGFVSVFFTQKKEDVFLYSGIVLFLSILIYFIYHIIKLGFSQAFHDSVVDISYFILSVPFLLWYIVVHGNTLKEKPQ